MTFCCLFIVNIEQIQHTIQEIRPVFLIITLSTLLHVENFEMFIFKIINLPLVHALHLKHKKLFAHSGVKDPQFILRHRPHDELMGPLFENSRIYGESCGMQR